MPTTTTPAEAPPQTSLSFPADEVIDALLAGVVRIKRRAEIYESDAVTPFAIPNWNARLFDGSVNVDGTRDERRMLDLSLENEDNALKLDPYSGFWYDKIIKVFWGIKYFDGTGLAKAYETQIGEFMIDRISEDRFPHVVKVTGRDYAKKCLTSKTKASMTFKAGTPAEEIIRAVAANAGITKFALPVTGQSYALDLVFEQFTERWAVIKKVADSIGYDVYFRGDGYLTMRPYADPYLDPTTWIFRGGKQDGTLIDFNRSSNDSRIKNHIIVQGATLTTADGYNTVIWYELRNDDPRSPTNIARIGDRVDPIQNDLFTSVEFAKAFAEKRMKILALEEYQVDFSNAILPWLEANDIVDVDESNGSNYVPSRFVLSSFSFPLKLGAMSSTGRRVTIVGSSQRLEYQ